MYIIFIKYIIFINTSKLEINKLISLNKVDHALNSPKWRGSCKTEAIEFYAIPSLGFEILLSLGFKYY
jgi:hypothetical protein